MNDLPPNDQILASQARRNAILRDETLRYYNMFINRLTKLLTEQMTEFPYSVDLSLYDVAPPSCHVAWNRFIERVRQQFYITNVTVKRRYSDKPGDNDEATEFSFVINDYAPVVTTPRSADTSSMSTSTAGTYHRDMAIHALAVEGITNPTREQIVAAMINMCTR
jgi:hypothetical protein